LAEDRAAATTATDVSQSAPPSWQVVVIATADGTVRRFPLPSSATPGRFVRVRFDGDVLLVNDDTWQRLDLATGTLHPADGPEWPRFKDEEYSIDCPARGLRLERRVRGDRQVIALTSTATAGDPERIASVDSRTLVSATDISGPGGDGAITMAWKHPEPLLPLSFTSACTHFVFELEQRVYVGDVASGKFALVAAGEYAGDE
jgi:hypothetical protein